MNKTLLISVIAAVLVATLAAWYLLHPRMSQAPAAQASTTAASDEGTPAPGFSTAADTADTVQGPLAPPRQEPDGYKEYRNTTYRFSLFYPQDLSVKSFDEGSGASTITLENDTTAQGFQIFVVPYRASQVNTQRFKEDEPSGVMQSPMPLSIDGANATAFLGADQLLGPTREVWMIHGGYLFEVSAPQPLDDWLGNIMLTWKFI